MFTTPATPAALTIAQREELAELAVRQLIAIALFSQDVAGHPVVSRAVRGYLQEADWNWRNVPVLDLPKAGAARLFRGVDEIATCYHFTKVWELAQERAAVLASTRSWPLVCRP